MAKTRTASKNNAAAWARARERLPARTSFSRAFSSSFSLGFALGMRFTPGLTREEKSADTKRGGDYPERPGFASRQAPFGDNDQQHETKKEQRKGKFPPSLVLPQAEQVRVLFRVPRTALIGARLGGTRRAILGGFGIFVRHFSFPARDTP
jgi:hypothetical protein